MGLRLFIMPHWSKFADELVATAKKIATPGKGILAADESTGTIGKRFDAIKLENNEVNRKNYRELLFTTEGIEESISGVIMYEETLFQSSESGESFVSILQKKGIVPGIKVDKGVAPLPSTDGEGFTQGLDGLHDRCAKYYAQGARFAKWRSVLQINLKKNQPSPLAIRENAWNLARYATICQANGLVPIVEPEILMDGDHDLEANMEITAKVVQACYDACIACGMLLEGSLLKPNMCLPGSTCASGPASPEQVAAATVRALSRSVPAAVPGVVFLSGGQSEEEATLNLNAINTVEGIPKPWVLTFSYGRALQQSCIKTWEGKAENKAAAQKALLERAGANGAAQLGKYAGGAGGDAAKASLYVANYSY